MRISGMTGALVVLLSGEVLLSGRPRDPRPPAVAVVPPAPVIHVTHRPAPRVPSVETTSEPVAPLPVREVPVDTLPDVAVADYREEGSVIYYNPTVMRRLGPLLSAFLMAHEYGHIELRHTRANALLAGRTALDSVLQARELAADCVAAGRLGQENRAAVMEAIRFFSRLGTVRFGAAHPPGSQRAAMILSCLPLDWTRSSASDPGTPSAPEVADHADTASRAVGREAVMEAVSATRDSALQKGPLLP